MAADNNEQAYKRLARRYVDHYGTLLLEEREALAHDGAARITPRLERNVKRMLSSHHARRFAIGLLAVAAVAAVVLVLPLLSRLEGTGIVGQPSASEATSAPVEAPAMSAEEVAPPVLAALIPLNFALPQHLTVTDSRVDNGRSVYYLANSHMDDIVMTLEKDADDGAFAALTPIRVNNADAYYKYTTDYSVMAFKKDGITYVLTCRHDVNTLLPLASVIL